MFSKSVMLALAAASVASAQTFTNCNPLKKTCAADPAFGSKAVNCDLTKGPCDVFHEFEGTKLTYDERGAVFAIEQDTNAPTIGTKKFMFFGRLDVEVQPAAGAGIVTSLVLQSDDLDEIDWEWVGGDDKQAQSNYFYKGDTTTYDRGAFHDVDGAVTKVNKYSIEYTPKAVKWFINDNVVRQITYEEVGGAKFPQTPMEVRLGTWVGGRKDKPKGTVDWAGGLADFKKAPFNAYYKSISIVDYAGGEGPTTKDVKEYIYSDKSGDYKSIEVVLGDGSSDGGDDETSSSASAKPTKSAEETKSAKPTTSAAEETSSHAESKTSSKAAAASSSFVSVTSSAASTPTVSESSTEESSVSSTGTAPPSSQTSAEGSGEAPEGAANSLNLGSAILVGAGLLAAQLLI